MFIQRLVIFSLLASVPTFACAPGTTIAVDIGNVDESHQATYTTCSIRLGDNQKAFVQRHLSAKGVQVAHNQVVDATSLPRLVEADALKMKSAKFPSVPLAEGQSIELPALGLDTHKNLQKIAQPFELVRGDTSSKNLKVYLVFPGSEGRQHWISLLESRDGKLQLRENTQAQRLILWATQVCGQSSIRL